MKKLRALFIAAVLLVLLFALPSPVHAAQALTLGSPVNGSFTNAADQRIYYTVDVTSAGQHLIVLLDAANNYNTYQLYIKFGADPTPSDYEDKGDGAHGDQAVEIVNTQVGTYHIMAYSNYNSGNFTIVAHDGSTFPALTLGTAKNGSLQDTYDVKYYQVPAASGKHLFALLDGANNYNNYDLFIQCGSLPNTTVYADMGKLPNADQAVEVSATQAGMCYVMIRSKSGGGNYSITAHDSSTFPTLTAGNARNGSFQDTYDAKFYQVTVAAGEHLTAVLDGADNYDTSDLFIKYGALPSIEFFDSKSSLPHADQAAEVPATQAGTYYILARSRAGGGNYAITAYTGATFPTLSIGSAKTASLQDTYDVKYYQVQAAESKHLTVILDGADNYDSYDLYVRYGALPTLTDFDGKGTLTKADQGAEIPITQTGTYYVMIYSTAGGGNFNIIAHDGSTFPTLTPGSSKTASFQDTYDVKFYQVNIDAGRHLFVFLDGADNYDNYDLYIRYGALPSLVDYVDIGKLHNADQAVEVASTQAGTYYVMVRSTASGGNFSIVAHTAATLPTLEFGASKNASLQGTYDVKFYQINLAAADHLFAFLDGADNYNNYDFYLRQGSLPTEIDYNAKSVLPNADQAVEMAGAPAGSYYVMIRSRAGGGNFIAAAHTTATFPTLALGTGKTASLQDTYDVKFYQVKLASPQHLFILLDAADNYDEYDLYLRSGSLPNTIDYMTKSVLPNADQAVEAAGAAAGSYYVMLRSRSSGGNYTITAHNSSTFPTLPLVTPKNGSLQDTYDVKFYQVTPEAGKWLMIWLDGEKDYYHYDMYVRFGALPSTTDFDFRENDDSADQVVIINPTGSGTYYIMIRAITGSGNFSIQAFHWMALLPMITK